MSKSVYSIVLADEVVEAVDAMAYQLNTSRSNLINQILAEHVSFVTPEMRIREIFNRMEQLMDARFQFLAQPSETMLSIKSPLRYKYKPTIRYSVELNRDLSGKVGRLKVQFRTQSAQLIELISGFFLMWDGIENKYLSEVFKDKVPSACEGGKYIRDFYSPSQEKLSDEDIGRSIGEYIQLMDGCIQDYFDNISDKTYVENMAAQKYVKYLKSGAAIL